MRLFLGCPVPPSSAYEPLTAELVAQHDASPVAPGSWHVTLRFLGNVPDAAPVIAALEAAAAGVAAMPCVVRGVGAFPSPQRARVAWAGVEAPGLAALAKRVVAATAHLGEAPDSRDFVAHATLARLRRPRDVSSWRRHHQERLLAEGVIDRVVVFRSALGPDGAAYARLHEANLAT